MCINNQKHKIMQNISDDKSKTASDVSEEKNLDSGLSNLGGKDLEGVASLKQKLSDKTSTKNTKNDQELAELRKTIDSLNEQLLRSKADLHNSKLRADKEIADTRKFATVKLIRSFTGS